MTQPKHYSQENYPLLFKNYTHPYKRWSLRTAFHIFNKKFWKKNYLVIFFQIWDELRNYQNPSIKTGFIENVNDVTVQGKILLFHTNLNDFVCAIKGRRMNISPTLQSSTACAPFPSLLCCAPQKQDEHMLSSSAPNFCHSLSKAKDSQPQTFTLEFMQSTLSHRNTFNCFFQKNSTFPVPSITLMSFEGTAGKSNAVSELQFCQCPPPSPQANTPLLLFKNKDRFHQMLQKHF